MTSYVFSGVHSLVYHLMVRHIYLHLHGSILVKMSSSFRVKWYDTKCDSKAALGAAVDAVKYFDPDLFIGPPCSQGESTL